MLRSLMGFTSTNLKELLIEGAEGAATFSTFVEFLGTVKLQLIFMDIFIRGENEGFCSTSFINAVEWNYDLCWFPVDRLKNANDWQSFLSSGIRRILDGILVVKKAG